MRIKWIVLGALLAAVAGGLGFVAVTVVLFERSTRFLYDVPLVYVSASSDAAVIARGKHLAESLGKCQQCHGDNLGGGKDEPHGPFGHTKGPNLTTGRNGVAYLPAELARLIKHGVKRNGQTVIYMPSHEMSWWPAGDVAALASYLRTLPPVDSEPGYVKFGLMAKIFDRLDLVQIDIARRISHENEEVASAPAPTPEYGAYIAKLCVRCHGERFDGGPLPGAPPSLPIPSNLTPDPSGLAAWTYEDFDRLLTTGIKKNGKALDPFMSLGAMGKMDDTEKRALWAYLRSLPPRPMRSS